MSSHGHIDSLIEEALNDAAIADGKSRNQKTGSAYGNLDEHQKLATLLRQVASKIESLSKTATKTLSEKKKDAEVANDLRKIFIGKEIDETDVKRRQRIKRRVEEMGGLAAPTI